MAFCLAVVVTVAGSWPPAPEVHDEFSYLLGADTFVHGRLTNRQHPLWEHFETFHVLSHPSYATKFPPAQSAVLALGQRLTGQPITGVWLSFGLMGAALTWMLLAWFSPRWSAWGALFITLLFLRTPNASYFARSYWGGAVAVIGGALVLGGIRRATTTMRLSSAWLTGLGLAILATSRPYEGLLAAFPSAVLLGSWLARSRETPPRMRLTRVVLPVAVVLGGLAAAMGYYNWRVTGSAVRMPYAAYQETYGTTPLFIWQPRGAHQYRNEPMREFYASGSNPRTPKTFRQVVRLVWDRLERLARFFVPPSALILLIVAATLRREAWFPVAVSTLGLCVAGTFVTSWMQAHYLAPMVGALAIVFTGGARHLAALRVGHRRTGRFVVHAVLCFAVLAAAATAFQIYRARGSRDARWARQRSQIAARLEATGGKHVVFV
ncbi:MAG: hypothetical protein ACREOG_10175, partial [Gemmatimonadaceae bacterium]